MHLQHGANTFSLLKEPLPIANATATMQKDKERGWEQFSNAIDGQRHANPDKYDVIAILLENKMFNSLLSGIFAHSPYLRYLLIEDPLFVAEIDKTPPHDLAAALVARINPKPQEAWDKASLMQRMRKTKKQIGLLCALMDLGNIWGLSDVTNWLSIFAAQCLETALAFLLREAHHNQHITLKDSNNPTYESGFLLLAMGKLGAKELNYSSDIDFIALFDPEKFTAANPANLQRDLVRMTRDLVAILETRTVDGYVFRTDLRLRPDPGATPLVMSIRAAETYYETLGQNWERAAMMKARHVAGDEAMAREFLAHIRPFIWRKHLDFAAIADIHAMKRQIHTHKGGAHIELNGHNIKIGRGGIRDIEFFTQTQQLIWGGRIEAIRKMQTCEGLNALADFAKITKSQAQNLIDAYYFLRNLEHRLQMVEDAQTHQLPDNETAFVAITAFMGFSNPQQFRTKLLSVLHDVERAYSQLFEQEPSLANAGNLVFTGNEADPKTIQTLRKLGYEHPERTLELIKNWHRGRYRALRAERARQILTELVPQLITAFANHKFADEAILQFDQFLSKLPAGVLILSLLQAQPRLLSLLALIMADAPHFARQLAKRPVLLDGIIADDFIKHDAVSNQRYLAHRIAKARDYEDMLNIVRAWANDQKFHLYLKLLQGELSGEVAGPLLSSIADTAIATIASETQRDFAQFHGTFVEQGFAILAMGKLGGQELAPASDVDLIFVYDAPAAETSNGQQPLSTGPYFQRLCQRIVTNLVAETSEGKLYLVDTRLRPSGNASPLATHIDRFTNYYTENGKETAWSWEYMALTRARIIMGTPHLSARISAVIQKALCQPRDKDKLANDIASMRHRITATHQGKDFWDIKYRPGGLVDIEFIAQFLQLAHCAKAPSLCKIRTHDTLELAAQKGLLPKNAEQDLSATLTFWQNLQAILRLSAEADNFTSQTASQGQKNALMKASGCKSFLELEQKISTQSKKVRHHFENIIAPLSPP